MAQGRQLYENTLTPTRDIATKMGLSRNTLDNRIAEWKWVRRKYTSGEQAAAAPGTDVSVAESAPALPVQTGAYLPAPIEARVNFAERLTRSIEEHFNVIDRTLKVLIPANAAEAERTTRTLAVISHTMQQLNATANSAGLTPTHETDDDSVPRDLDEFRNELARRIHAAGAVWRRWRGSSLASNGLAVTRLPATLSAPVAEILHGRH
jgi:hypothetical protein